MALPNSLLKGFSGKFRRWKVLPNFPATRDAIPVAKVWSLSSKENSCWKIGPAFFPWLRVFPLTLKTQSMEDRTYGFGWICGKIFVSSDVFFPIFGGGGGEKSCAKLLCRLFSSLPPSPSSTIPYTKGPKTFLFIHILQKTLTAEWAKGKHISEETP